MSNPGKDKDLVWHPFTHLKFAGEHICIEKAEGAYYFDEKGNRYIDAISSWWVNLHGHSHPYINKKIAEQLQRFEHSIFSGFTHKPAVELAERLLKHLSGNQSKIFYSDNGSTAVEVALKMTLQFWDNKGESKPLFIAFENAYHGDTFGGMSVGERNVFNNAFNSLLFDVVHVPLPNANNIDELIPQLQSLFTNHSVAGFIFEPLVQGAAGMLMYEAKYLDQLIGLCRENKVITIADEVMTGFGRTGKFFASEYLQNKPDIICLSKGITGGYMPLGVTSCAQFIYDAFVSDNKEKTFYHGHSYTGNPTACAAALASLDLMEEKETWFNIERISKKHSEFLTKLKDHEGIKDIRQTGTILAIELNTEEHTHYLNNAAEKISDFFLKQGILLRPLGNVFYILPPYCISDTDLDLIYSKIETFLAPQDL
jgi:adenosylmethionine---8-amino-7-oxononanoate aminotransferase